jgi:hypothetical protein
MLEVDDEHPSKLLHREITERIIGAAFEVHGELGYGSLDFLSHGWTRMKHG